VSSIRLDRSKAVAEGQDASFASSPSATSPYAT
jgi:hypothetical protein